MGRLDEKVALITGGAMGIGRACAEHMAKEGAHIIVTDIDDVTGQQTVSSICEQGAEAIFLPQDVTSESQWQSVLESILTQYGQLNVLVNNAGIAIRKPFLELTLDEFHRQNAVNLDGVFLGMKTCIPAMAKSGAASIINVSSVAGLKAAPTLAAYSMTKGGVRLLSKSVAKECALAGLEVRINSIHPGIIDTAIWQKMNETMPGDNRRTAEAGASGVPGNIVGKPADIANAVVFLASDESRYMNGSEVVVDFAYSA